MRPGPDCPDVGGLRAAAELLSGQTIHPAGGVVNLTTAEWLERWQKFRTTRPADHAALWPVPAEKAP
jgi:hypothetical protein